MSLAPSTPMAGQEALAHLAEILAVPDRRIEVRIFVRELPAATDWPTESRKFAQHLRRTSPGIDNNTLAPLVQARLRSAGVFSRGGRLPSIASILRRGLS